MRQKRAKAYKKQMTVYLHTFKFREPFQAIVDDELILNCEKAQFHIEKGLNRTIQGETKPMITQCCMQALYDSGNQNAIDVGKTFERRRCNHREAIAPKECVESIVNINHENKHRYIVATQNYELRKALRRVPGVPLIFMNRSVMVMESLSDASARYSESFERKKLTQGLNDKKAGKILPPKEAPVAFGEPVASGEPTKKKSKGPKGPNPLSIKKKTAEKPEIQKTSDKPKTTRRKRSHKKDDNDNNNDDEGNGEKEDRVKEPKEKKIKVEEPKETDETKESIETN